ncbi:hypothetical protein GVAV_001654 [Gurleya vavrai]
MVKHNDKEISYKDLNFFLEVTNFLKNDNRMAFYMYFNNCLMYLEKSQFYIKNHMIYEIFKYTKTYVCKVIDNFKLKMHASDSYVLLLQNHFIIQLKNIKMNIANKNNQNENHVSKLKNEAFNDLKEQFFIDFDEYSKHHNYYNETFETKKIQSDVCFEESFGDDSFNQILVSHFKNSISKFLKELWQKTNIFDENFELLTTEYLSNLKKNIEFFFEQVITEMRKNIFDYRDIIEPIFFKFNFFYNFKEILNHNTLQTIKNVMIAESLIIFEDGRFLYNYIINKLKPKSYPLMEFKTFIENNKIVLPSDPQRFDLYKDLLMQSDSSMDKNFKPNSRYIRMLNSCDKPFEIFEMYFDKRIVFMHEKFKKIFEIPKIEKLPLVYNIFYYKHLLSKELYRPLDKNYKNYHRLIYTLEKLNPKNTNDYSMHKHKKLNEFNDFQRKFDMIFNESENKDLTQIEFQKILNDVDEYYFENYHSNEVDKMLMFNINDLLQKYKIIFSSLYETNTVQNFINPLMQNIYPLYYLSFLGFDKASQFKNSFEKTVYLYYNFSNEKFPEISEEQITKFSNEISF